MTEADFAARRARMVDEQLRARGIRDEAVLRAFAAVPRERFVPRFAKRLAYLPVPIPIGQGQTLSQPLVVARMLELAGLTREDTVLDVGAGSGYQTALLAHLCRRVWGLEILPALAARANAVLRGLGLTHASVHVADGARGLPEHAPYDAIVAAAAAREVPRELLDQLADGGRLVVPVGRQMSKRAMAWRMLRRAPAIQHLHRVTRRAGRFDDERLEGVHFVPFVGA
jgi:protein-L-isoaspartate(D-aspartate) O-methyltransferase